MQLLKSFVLTVVLSFCGSSLVAQDFEKGTAGDKAAANEFTFLCSWLNRAPITINVDIEAGVASRSDGGRKYRVVKASSSAVWLEISEPERPDRLALQIIERQPSESVEGGTWLDLTISSDGTLSPIADGICWEQ